MIFTRTLLFLNDIMTITALDREKKGPAQDRWAGRWRLLQPG
jgi:hypothetical protein